MWDIQPLWEGEAQIKLIISAKVNTTSTVFSLKPSLISSQLNIARPGPGGRDAHVKYLRTDPFPARARAPS